MSLTPYGDPIEDVGVQPDIAIEHGSGDPAFERAGKFLQSNSWPELFCRSEITFVFGFHEPNLQAIILPFTSCVSVPELVPVNEMNSWVGPWVPV